ncbi:hypothetical protein COT93_03255 [Candidatus Falkowbacteria bacterium CG10_big_fil_rev_8_21_14_0_10_37_18]|uniref:Radical SAM core domain-containing protein n=1 Tax=Candidatus Falkowbacteria bacterium CG10_big_fil_rev_8_21_14_0_10_37_18 TaxID=1974562 RepID=A0A2H0V882_9BACT|nr:radical SAM protein [Candidatus Falkowbacteria bacterium]OIO06298.1 MAG: hypothetical protein AUJ26_01035 [Candidatus Falkowbacteria bacterium CG1_02_37_21]PIR95283.1 MAG: hypothetical protein COT93_03255 [Candidatus Falkowbacteria bacterium CG10_big_fil_rev_8_21_14_0_10_37_18]
MKIVNFHHLGVPCLTKERINSELFYDKKDIFYLNPEAIIRSEPDGAVITPPLLYSSFLSVDSEALAVLDKHSFSLEKLSVSTVNLLLENKVILDTPPKPSHFRRLEAAVSGLPTQALFEVTSFCNCNCIGCYHWLDLGNNYPPLSDLIKRIIKLKNLGISLFEVTGGEPFSRPDLSEVLNYINDSGMHFYVVTNGSYLAESSSELLSVLRQGLGVAVSLDGVGATHDRVRRQNGLYAKIIKGLDLMFKEGIKIYLVSTLNEENIDCAEELVEVARKYQTTIHFRPTIRTGAAVINNLAPIDLKTRLKNLLGLPEVRNGLLSTKKVIPQSKYYGCGLRKRISIDSFGALYPCVMDRRQVLGNIDTYFPESLILDLEKETRSFLAANRVCRDCDYNKNQIRCGGFCRFSNKYRS